MLINWSHCQVMNMREKILDKIAGAEVVDVDGRQAEQEMLQL
jgi:hypothetical protein